MDTTYLDATCLLEQKLTYFSSFVFGLEEVTMEPA